MNMSKPKHNVYFNEKSKEDIQKSNLKNNDNSEELMQNVMAQSKQGYFLKNYYLFVRYIFKDLL